jgi:hypothetical protein
MDENIVETVTQIHYYFNLTTAIALTTIGLIGNTLVFYILTRPKFRKISIFRYLIVLTGFDTFVLLTIWPYNLPDLFLMRNVALSCKLVQYMSYIAYQFCPWIIVISSIDRYMAVKYPSKYQFRNDLKYQASILSAVFIVLVFTDIPFYLYYDIFSSANQTFCGTVDVFTGFYIDLANLLISTILPFSLMILTTCLIARELYTQRLKLEKNKKRFNRELQFIKVMCAMDLFFLICNLPFCIQMIVYDVLAMHDIFYFFWTFIYDLTDFLIFIHCTCSFFLYFLFNRRFRYYFYLMIGIRRKRPIVETNIGFYGQKINLTSFF